MGKKKGGSKNKLAKMSEEERARYLQHRADIEEEARRRKQQLISLYMKNKLKREEAFSRLNLAKINQEWRSILRQIKCDELRHEIEEVEKFFVAALEQKNRIIHRMLTDLDVGEEMYSTMQNAHMENTEKLIAIQTQRMEFFKTQYETQKSSILNACKEDFERFDRDRSQSQRDLECVFFCLEEERDGRLVAQDEKHAERLDDLRSAFTLKLEQISKSREERLETLWQEYQQILSGYVKHTEDFYEDYMHLKEQDGENEEITVHHGHDVEAAAEQLAELKLYSDTITEEASFQIGYLQKYRNDLSDTLQRQKRELEELVRGDAEEFKLMSVCGHNAIKELQKWLKKGESVMQLATACRKHETEAEKVLPIGTSREHFGRDESEVTEPPENTLKDTAFSNWMQLEKFWKRVNYARLDVACLKEEKTSLERKNAQLKSALKKYLTSVSIANGQNGSAKDRILIRPSSMRVEKVTRSFDGDQIRRKSGPPKPRRRPYTCVEANFSNAVRSAKLAEGKQNTAKIRTVVNWC